MCETGCVSLGRGKRRKGQVNNDDAVGTTWKSGKRAESKGSHSESCQQVLIRQFSFPPKCSYLIGTLHLGVRCPTQVPDSLRKNHLPTEPSVTANSFLRHASDIPHPSKHWGLWFQSLQSLLVESWLCICMQEIGLSSPLLKPTLTGSTFQTLLFVG